jgi:uncharacterized protein (DUF427 family)
MIEQTIKVPDARHPIAIERHSKRIVVFAGGKVIADTERALTLREADHPSVLYIPRRDVAMHALQRSSTASYCPYKGEASHFSLRDEGPRSEDAAWAYEAPYWAVAAIENHMAFNPERVDRIEVR